MKVLVFSDSHGNTKYMTKAIDFFTDIDTIIHLGDYSDDIDKIKKQYSDKKFVQVAGNNDFTNIEDEKIVTINGYKVFLTHGHLYDAYWGIDKLFYKSKEIGSDVCLYGHTHTPLAYFEDDVLILNPGSISFPRGFSHTTTLIIDFADDIQYKFYCVNDDEIKHITI